MPKPLYFAVLAFIFIIVFALWQCSDNNGDIQSSITTDSTYTKPLPPAPPIVIHDTIPKIRIVIRDAKVDSSIIRRLLAERDSLTNILQDSSVRITFSADTVHPVTRDTLHIECDELNRHINYSLAYAPRTEKITIQTKTFFKEVTFWEKIFYAVCGFGIGEILHYISK